MWGHRQKHGAREEESHLKKLSLDADVQLWVYAVDSS